MEITERGLHREITWRVDGEAVAEGKSHDERFALAAPGHGSIGLHFRTFSGTRRVTWFEHSTVPAALAANKLLVGGADFEPEPGSKADRRQTWMRAHPRLYTARQVVLAAVGVALGVLATWLGSRLLRYLPDIRWPRIPWPDIDWPDIPLPRIPWPDLPSIPLPDWNLPDLHLPGWVGLVMEGAKYILPVAFAGWLAAREAKRRRRARARPPESPPTQTDIDNLSRLE